ncbi:MAG: hypothetical protein OEX17_08895 [Rhodospirillaceae bacterium]|nr:hypothetical protein [Rhodospirillaceae bacterium]
MKIKSQSKENKIEAKSLLSGFVSIFLAVGTLSIIAISLGIAQMA